ncbi:hypothetical protein Hanom_Chr10g00933621 [Helianthus anomalus]
MLVDEFSGKLSGIATKFKSLRSSFEDEVVVRKLFLQILASIEQHLEMENMPLEEVVGRLKACEEERIKDHDEKDDDPGKLLLSKEW